MPLYDEVWNENEYIPRSHVYLQSLARNAHEKVKSLAWDFVEYKTQQDLPCLLYERLYTHCANHYGLITATQHPECSTVLSYLNTCLEQHEFHGYMKKYNPEFYANFDAARTKTNFEDLVGDHRM